MKTYALFYMNEIFSGRRPRPARRPEIGAVLRTYAARIEQRRALAKLEPRLLRDIGIDADAAREEAEKPFWEN